MADAIRHHLSSRWAGEMGWLGPLLCLPADPDRDRSPNWPFMYHVAGFAAAAAHEAPPPLRRIDAVRRDRIHSVSAGQLYPPNGYDRESQKLRTRFASYHRAEIDLRPLNAPYWRPRLYSLPRPHTPPTTPPPPPSP